MRPTKILQTLGPALLLAACGSGDGDPGTGNPPCAIHSVRECLEGVEGTDPGPGRGDRIERRNSDRTGHVHGRHGTKTAVDRRDLSDRIIGYGLGAVPEAIEACDDLSDIPF